MGGIGNIGRARSVGHLIKLGRIAFAKLPNFSNLPKKANG